MNSKNRKNRTTESDNLLDETERNSTINALGYIEGMLISPIDGSGLLYGWVTKEEDSIEIKFNASDGTSISENDIIWRPRPDVIAAFPNMHIQNDRPGFIALLPPGKAERKISLIASNGWNIIRLASSPTARTIPINPRDAAQLLFGVQTEDDLFAERCTAVDGKILSAMIDAHCLQNSRRKVMEERLGATLVEPQISIIIPLFRRFDFVENQILEFEIDKFIRGNAEVIYVIDDPVIVNDVRSLVRKMHSLTNFPIRLLWNNMNGGYSFANNLGVAKSLGKKLLFLNSDVIPRYPGWLETLVETLGSDCHIGAVGARLLSPGGSLQHDGMAFRYNDQLSIWINEHPFTGVEPSLIPDNKPHNVEALTGACLLVQRNVIESIGGWDTRYLIGDFEDSDLCLSIRSLGLTCCLDPRVTLTHLERQSFTTIGDSSFRTKVAIFNAARHQSKWGTVIDKSHRAKIV